MHSVESQTGLSLALMTAITSASDGCRVHGPFCVELITRLIWTEDPDR